MNQFNQKNETEKQMRKQVINITITQGVFWKRIWRARKFFSEL